jgi:hypothetical protein
MDMTKFNDLDDPAFIAICGELRRWIGELRTYTDEEPLRAGSLEQEHGGQRSIHGKQKSVIPATQSLQESRIQSMTSEASGNHGQSKRKHIPAFQQLEGGSWVLDTITGQYDMESCYVRRDGKLQPTPADPSVFDSLYITSAEMAKLGHYDMPRLNEVPDQFFEPNIIADNWRPRFPCGGGLCRPCAFIVDNILRRLLLGRNSIGSESPFPVPPQLDVDVANSLEELKASAEAGCRFCQFLILAVADISPYRLERHISSCDTRLCPVQVVGHTSLDGKYFRALVWLRHPGNFRDLSKRMGAFELATMARDYRQQPIHVSEVDGEVVTFHRQNQVRQLKDICPIDGLCIYNYQLATQVDRKDKFIHLV